MPEFPAAVHAAAVETDFSGVVTITRDTDVLAAAAYGLADQACEIPNSVTTRFGVASGAKGFTALTIMRLVELGNLTLATTARSVLVDDLPRIDDAVTIEHLLTHTSGIGDYIVDGEFDDWPFTVPPSALDSTDAYLAVLDGHAQRAAPGTTFEYCDGAFVVLAVIAERVGGGAFPELVRELVVEPAGLTGTGYLRMDELPSDTALGYLDDGRTNVDHLPVVGSGDGGIFTTAADIAALWRAVDAGEIVSAATFAEMTRPHQDAAAHSSRYGLGFWLDETRDIVILEGCDAGVSFRSRHEPATGITGTVLSNTTDGAWPVVRSLAAALDG